MVVLKKQSYEQISFFFLWRGPLGSVFIHHHCFLRPLQRLFNRTDHALVILLIMRICTCPVQPAGQLIGADDIVQLSVVVDFIHEISEVLAAKVSKVHFTLLVVH